MATLSTGQKIGEAGPATGCAFFAGLRHKKEASIRVTHLFLNFCPVLSMATLEKWI